MFLCETRARRAALATRAGAFETEIVPVPVETSDGIRPHVQDEGIRYDATLESIGSVKLLQEGGVISAANASQICDGASGALIVSERALKTHNLTPIARIHAMTVTAGDPVIMLEEPIRATRRALERAGMTMLAAVWIRHYSAAAGRMGATGVRSALFLSD